MNAAQDSSLIKFFIHANLPLTKMQGCHHLSASHSFFLILSQKRTNEIMHIGHLAAKFYTSVLGHDGHSLKTCYHLKPTISN